ncbi:uncharacterized protein [Panulirus ornatus]|uniref:uncharacterized protein n=1 Tax=Panulirus ornatus TaxID=150431 RepID=UPI003A880A9C
MKILAAICLLAVGVSAQVGYSGIISPDGVNTQFSHDFARKIVLIGPSGIVTSSGENRQLTAGEAALHVGTQPVVVPVSQYLYRGVVGPSGIVRPDGNNVQFDGSEALVGPSGIVKKNGQNVQFTDDHYNYRSKRALVGPSGAILKDGTPIHFRFPGTYVLLDGPSGIVFSDGQLHQKRECWLHIKVSIQIFLSRICCRHDAVFLLAQNSIGTILIYLALLEAGGTVLDIGEVLSDIPAIPTDEILQTIIRSVPTLTNSNENILIPRSHSENWGSRDHAGRPVYIGLLVQSSSHHPACRSLLGNSKTFELNIDMKILAAICVLAVGVSAQVGPSGIISPDGVNTQFSHDFASNIVLVGPSGIVTKTGDNRQLTAGEAELHVATQPVPMPVSFYVQKGSIGPSGIVSPTGANVQFTQAEADNTVLVGPSGIVRKDGNNVQLDAEHHRAKRHLIGPSGMIFDDGTQVQFTEEGTYILLEGPSGYVLSDGQLFQKSA